MGWAPSGERNEGALGLPSPLCWEERKAAAEKELRAAATVLPGLYQSLRALEEADGETESLPCRPLGTLVRHARTVEGV